MSSSSIIFRYFRFIKPLSSRSISSSESGNDFEEDVNAIAKALDDESNKRKREEGDDGRDGKRLRLAGDEYVPGEEDDDEEEEDDDVEGGADDDEDDDEDVADEADEEDDE